jgi:hypothetical protein
MFGYEVRVSGTKVIVKQDEANKALRAEHAPIGAISAFSSEVNTGSRQENTIKQRSRAAFRFRGI